MTSKLPWATAAILIVAAVAVGTWAIYGVPVEEGEQPPTPPTPPPVSAGTISVGPGVVIGAGEPAYSGIENVYIMEFGNMEDNCYDLKENEFIFEYEDNDQVIEASGQGVNVSYENRFVIVVAFRVDNDNCADISRLDYFTIHIKTSANEINDNTTSENMFCFDNDTGSAGATDWGEYNAVFDNFGEGFYLPAGGTLTIDNIDLYVYGVEQ